MTDLEINVALAKAMGWVEISKGEWFCRNSAGFRIYEDKVQCSYGTFDNYHEFDYRDPAIFVAICKRWNLDLQFNAAWSLVSHKGIHTSGRSIEKAAALCVIDAAKRGVK